MRFISKRACRSFHDWRFVGVQHGALGDAALDPRQRLAFRLEHARQRLAAALADHDHDLALAGLVSAQAAVNAVLLQVGGLHVAAEVGAIDFGLGAVVADLAALHFLGHGFAQLVREHEGRLVGQAEIAAQRQHRLALDLVAEDRDGREIAAQRQLVARRTACPT